MPVAKFPGALCCLFTILMSHPTHAMLQHLLFHPLQGAYLERNLRTGKFYSEYELLPKKKLVRMIYCETVTN